MIFGRKREQEAADEVVDEVSDAAELTEDEDDVEFEDEGDDSAGKEAQWEAWDEAFTRDEGPFDIDEVDLDADEVNRLDLGTLIITPFEQMTMQLQVDQAQENVQAILVADGSSAMEVALFAGPSRTSMLPEIREEVIAATERENGTVELVEGPFGAELRRRLPVTDASGDPAIHVSRTWLVSGPGWVLRGVVMGKAALQPDDEDAELALFELFSNLVVRRGSEPAAPGSLLHMTVPTLDD